MATFESVARLDGKTAVGVPVPDAVVESLGAGRRVPITVSINGYSYRSSVAPYKGEYMIALSAENRTAAGVAPGDRITVTIEVDREPRVVEVPADLQEALDASPEAAAAWARLSFSHQRAHAESIEGAKTADTRARRVDAAIAKLTTGP